MKKNYDVIQKMKWMIKDQPERGCSTSNGRPEGGS